MYVSTYVRRPNEMGIRYERHSLRRQLGGEGERGKKRRIILLSLGAGRINRFDRKRIWIGIFLNKITIYVAAGMYNTIKI